MKSFGLLVLLVAVVHSANSGKVCVKNTDCEPSECCQILSEFQIVSKREDVSKSGTCKPYTPEGVSCDPWGRRNGYCSCEPGTNCVGYNVEIPTKMPKIMSGSTELPKVIARRDYIPGRRWKCVKA